MTKQKILSFTDLDAWKQAHQLVLAIYSITKQFPKEEIYALSNQMQRAALSISSNLAEGFSRQTKKEKQQFYFMSKGSLTEIQNQLSVARDLGYIPNNIFQDVGKQTVIVHKLLNGLLKTSTTHTKYKIQNTKYKILTYGIKKNFYCK